MNTQNNKGFTLVEMAIVLVVIGLLVGMGAGLIGPLTTMSKVRESREVVEADIASVVSWAASNVRLPNGYTEFQTVISRPNDAWGNAVYYFYDQALTTGNICGRKTTSLTICKTAACAVADRITNIATAVISGGANHNAQTGIIACPTGVTGLCVGVFEVDTANIDNCSDTTNCPAMYGNATFNQTNRPESYDDIVRWVTLDELRSKIGCQGAQLKIVNNELPYGYKGTPYSVQVYADGGSPFISSGKYKWCLKGTLPQGITNPTSGCPATTDCSSLGTEGEWLQADYLTIPTTPASPTAEGSYNFKILVRDNNDNSTSTSVDSCSEKSFVLTINP